MTKDVHKIRDNDVEYVHKIDKWDDSMQRIGYQVTDVVHRRGNYGIEDVHRIGRFGIEDMNRIENQCMENVQIIGGYGI